jgi:hypothetical protein
MGSINDDVDHGVVITEIKLRITEIWRACLFEANYLATYYVRNSSSAPSVRGVSYRAFFFSFE